MTKSKVKNIMDSLHISEEEAKEVLAYDEQIENGEKTEYDLPKDKEKVVKDYTKVKPTVYTFTKPKERKENTSKKQIIADLYDFLANMTENATITNAERQISFIFGDNQYELTLVQKRKPKNGE